MLNKTFGRVMKSLIKKTFEILKLKKQIYRKHINKRPEKIIKEHQQGLK